MVIPARDLIDLCHVILNDIGKTCIVLIIGFTDLEIDVRILDRCSYHRVFRVQSLRTESVERFIVDKTPKVLIVHLLDFADLVGRAEAVKEMKERDSAANGRKVRDTCQIHNFLDITACEHGEPGRAAVHDIGVVSENGEGVCSDRTACHVQNARKTFACDPVHRRDHEHKSLRGREARRKSSGLKRSVNSGDRA